MFLFVCRQENLQIAANNANKRVELPQLGAHEIGALRLIIFIPN